MDIEEVSFADIDMGPACETCGAGLVYSGRGRKPRFCDAHKPAPSRTVKRPAGRVANAKTVGVVSKILIILTAVMAHRQCKRYGVVNDQLEETLTMTDDEADAIATPIARWSMKSTVGAKVLGPIVDNEDLIDAAVAVWEYNRRTSQIVKEMRKLNNVANESPAEAKPKPAVNGSGISPAIASIQYPSLI